MANQITGSNDDEISYNHVHGDPDLQVKVQDCTFHVHKTVLMETSDYFRAMLESGMRESRENSVQLQGFAAEAFQIVLDFLYESKPVKMDDKLHGVLEMAQFLQMRPVLDYIKSKLSCENCVHLYMLADTYVISDLKEAAAQLMGDNYLKFSSLGSFRRAEGGPARRGSEDALQTPEVLVWCEHGVCDVARARSQGIHVLRQLKGRLEIVDSKARTGLQTGWGVAVLDNYIYVMGGYSTPRSIHPSGDGDVQAYNFCYDPVKNKWTEERAMNEARAYFGAVTHDDSVYAIGGFQYHFPVQTMERYIPEQDRWEFRRSLPGDWTNYDLAVVCKGDIYVNSEERWEETFSLLKYVTSINQWEILSELPRKRDKNSMVAVGETIYLLGGLVPGVDCFNVTTKQWFLLEDHPATEAIHYEKGCTEMDGTIYVLNGDDMACYILEAQTWVQGLTAFPGGVNTNKAIVVHLPPERQVL
ncbi:protein polyubiquitination [Branchiostoma belcheri]|nr:protein polyubiquitination [Branchiostoma belcheri]